MWELVWKFVVLLSAFWLLGLALNIAGNIIALVLALTIALTIYNLLRAPEM